MEIEWNLSRAARINCQVLYLHVLGFCWPICCHSLVAIVGRLCQLVLVQCCSALVSIILSHFLSLSTDDGYLGPGGSERDYKP